MKDIFLNAVFIGGVLPMMFFGVLNTLQKPFADKVSTPAWIWGIAFGGILTALLYSFLFEKSVIFKDIGKKEFLFGVLGGVIWAGAILSFGVAYQKYNANAAQIMPIAMANGIVTVLLSFFFLKEDITAWRVLSGTVLIFLGAVLVNS